MKKKLLGVLLLVSGMVFGSISAGAVEVVSQEGSLAPTEWDTPVLNATAYEYSQEKGEYVDLDELAYNGRVYNTFELDPSTPALLIQDYPVYYYYNMLDNDFDMTYCYFGGQETISTVTGGDANEKIAWESAWKVQNAEPVAETGLAFTFEDAGNGEMQITASDAMDGIVLLRGEYGESLAVALHEGKGYFFKYDIEEPAAEAVIYAETIECEPEVEVADVYESGSRTVEEETLIHWTNDLMIQFPEELNGLVLSYDETADRIMVSGVRGSEFIGAAAKYLPEGETPSEEEAESYFRVFGYLPFDEMEDVQLSGELDMTWEEAFQQLDDNIKHVMTREGYISYEEYLEQKK